MRPFGRRRVLRRVVFTEPEALQLEGQAIDATDYLDNECIPVTSDDVCVLVRRTVEAVAIFREDAAASGLTMNFAQARWRVSLCSRALKATSMGQLSELEDVLSTEFPREGSCAV